MAEWTETHQPQPPVIQEHWNMYFDGSFTLNGARGGVVLISPKGDWLLHIIRMSFHTANKASPSSSGFSGFTSMATLSSS
jgi:hypothetical protein